MGSKTNNKMEARMEALERMVEENREALTLNREAMEDNRITMDSRLGSIESLLQKLAATWERPATEETMQTSGVKGKNREREEEGARQWRQIEMPIFMGEDPVGWVASIERYFRLQAVKEDEKLEAILVAMDEEALAWFQWWESWEFFPTLGGFQAGLGSEVSRFVQFGPEVKCHCGAANCQGFLGTKKKIGKLDLYWGSKRKRTSHASCITLVTAV